jgi:hypothetical protein
MVPGYESVSMHDIVYQPKRAKADIDQVAITNRDFMSTRPKLIRLTGLRWRSETIMVLQLRHENVSNCALFSSDLLLSIASPQSGQCRIGGRGGAGIRATVYGTAATC